MNLRTIFTIFSIFEDEPILLSPFLCSADDDGGDGDGGGGGGGSEGGDDAGDSGGDDGGKGGTGDKDGGGGDDDGGEPDAGLMSEAGKEEEGDKDSGKTIEHDGETLNVPEKFWDKDAEKLNEGAVLKAAIDAGKNVRQLQNDLAKAKKDGAAAQVDTDVPKETKGYLTDGEGDDALIKDGHFQLGEDPKALKPVPIDDPIIQLFAEVAKEEGFSKERFERIVRKVLIGVDDAVEVLDLEAEAEKFGPNAKAVAGTNKTWADNMLESGAISKAEHVHLLNMGQTAVGLSVVNKLRIKGGGKAIPVSEGGIDGELPSKAEWYAKKPDHRTDPEGYKKWQEEGKEIFGTAPAGSSENGLGAPQSKGGHQASYADKGKDGGRTGAAGRRRI